MVRYARHRSACARAVPEEASKKGRSFRSTSPGATSRTAAIPPARRLTARLAAGGAAVDADDADALAPVPPGSAFSARMQNARRIPRSLTSIVPPPRSSLDGDTSHRSLPAS